MSRLFYRGGSAVLAALTLSGCSEPSGPIAPPTMSISAAANTYSGQAYALGIIVPALALNVKVADTGPLPPTGGKQTNFVNNFSVPGILQSSTLHATARGADNKSRSLATTQRTLITVAGNRILIEVLQANSRADCVNGSPVLSGGTVLTTLVVNGVKQSVVVPPNTSVPLGGGATLTLNEQSTTSNSITVNGVHVTGPGGVDIIVASAYSDINCGAPPV